MGHHRSSDIWGSSLRPTWPQPSKCTSNSTNWTLMGTTQGQSLWGKLGGIKSRPIGPKDSIRSTEISSRTTGVYHQNNGWSTSKNTKSSVWRTQLSALNDEIVQNSQISVISRHFPVISVINMNKLKFFTWHTLQPQVAAWVAFPFSQ